MRQVTNHSWRSSPIEILSGNLHLSCTTSNVELPLSSASDIVLISKQATDSLTMHRMKSDRTHWICSILFPMALESVFSWLKFHVQIKIFDSHSSLNWNSESELVVIVLCPMNIAVNSAALVTSVDPTAKNLPSGLQLTFLVWCRSGDSRRSSTTDKFLEISNSAIYLKKSTARSYVNSFLEST